MRRLRWFSGLVVFMIAAVLIIFSDKPLMIKFLTPLLLSGFLALFRIFKGPTAADRAVAIDVLGILVIGICAIMSVFTKKFWYMDIAIAWALQSFISVLALAKYLEGRDFDD